MTDKIFSENPKWLVHKLIRRLRGALCADIVLLPWDMEDPYGHADGMVADLGENRILLNGCWKHNVPQFHNRLRKILDAHFEVVELSFDCKEDKDSWVISITCKCLAASCFLAYLNISIARTTSLPSKPSNDCFRIWKSFLSIQSRLSEKAGRYIV